MLIIPPGRFQVALDNLQSKCRMKTRLFRTMLEEFQGKLDQRCCDTVLNRIIPELAPEANCYGVGEVNLYGGTKNELKVRFTGSSRLFCSARQFPFSC